MIGRSAPMQEVFDLIRRLAPHVRTALICGETGTGKELVARALHQCGPRKAQALRRGQLLGGRRDALRIGAVRPRPRRVHRRDRQQGGPLRNGRRRHALPRRDRRAAAGAPGEAAARARDRRSAARRIAAAGAHRRQGRLRQQPGPRRGSGGGPVPERSPLPLERRPDYVAAAARPPRRHSLPHGRLPSGIRPAVRESPSPASRWPPRGGSARRRGPATSGSCATCSNARACSPIAPVITEQDIQASLRPSSVSTSSAAFADEGADESTRRCRRSRGSTS